MRASRLQGAQDSLCAMNCLLRRGTRRGAFTESLYAAYFLFRPE